MSPVAVPYNIVLHPPLVISLFFVQDTPFATQDCDNVAIPVVMIDVVVVVVGVVVV